MQGLDYIAWRVQREPLDQTNLSNGLDASSKAVGNRQMKHADRSGPQGLGGLQVGLGGPTWQPLSLRFGDVACGVPWNLLELVSRRNSDFSFDVWIPLDGFLIKLC